MSEGDNHSLSAPDPERQAHFRVFRDGIEVQPDQLPIQRAARGEVVSSEELEIRFEDGVPVSLLIQALPIRGSADRLVGAICAATDITENKRIEANLRARDDALRRLNEELGTRVIAEVTAREQAQARLAQAQRLEALGQLAGGIAHDFNNVLQAVSGGLGLIQRRAENPGEVRRLAAMAHDAAGRGAAITGRLLTFARRGELRAVPVRPVALLENLREILAPTLGAGIAVKIEANAGTPDLLADKAQLETVLVNLAVNARDAMREGGTLIISAHPDTVTDPRAHPAGLGVGHYVCVGLTDTGVGMDAATLARASEPFFTTKPPGRGTGLGLAMARGFAQQSGGGFALRSVPGQGTIVTLWFPRAPAVVQSNQARQSGGGTLASAPASRVLLVDDDAMVREVLAGQLEELGYHVTRAPDGLTALARLDAGEQPDLLVTDFSMPGMNGLDLMQEMRRRRPDLPALLLTGYADAGVRVDAEAIRNTATVVLRKPVTGDDLASHAAALLGAQAVE